MCVSTTGDHDLILCPRNSPKAHHKSKLNETAEVLEITATLWHLFCNLVSGFLPFIGEFTSPIKTGNPRKRNKGYPYYTRTLWFVFFGMHPHHKITSVS